MEKWGVVGWGGGEHAHAGSILCLYSSMDKHHRKWVWQIYVSYIVAHIACCMLHAALPHAPSSFPPSDFFSTTLLTRVLPSIVLEDRSIAVMLAACVGLRASNCRR